MRAEGLRVLVVEDDMLVAFMIEDILLDMGYAAPVVEMRLAPALAAAQAGPFDFAVLDINLAGEESFPVADALLAQGVPFIFATGYAAAVLPERFAGAAVLAKPFAAADLMAMVRAHAPAG